MTRRDECTRALFRRLVRHPSYFASRALALARARIFLRGAKLGPRVGASGRVRARIAGNCRIATRVTFRGGMLPTELVVHPGALLTLGEESVLNYGALIEAYERIEIGSRCMLASLVRICDREGEHVAPIEIGNDVWIAHGAIIGPGVKIGDGSVIGAGSVVTSDVPPAHLASGNPARSVPLTLVTREPAWQPAQISG